MIVHTEELSAVAATQPRAAARWMNLFAPFWRPESSVFLAVWLVLMIGGRQRFFHDPGTMWHTVVGEEMLRSGRMIYTDSFSFTFAGKPWIAHQWLGECLMALLHRVDRFDTLLLAAATLLAGIYTWIAARLIRSGLHWSLAVVFVGLLMAASSSHFHVRPHLGTIALLACTYALVCDFEADRSSLRRLALLVPIFLLWTNVHGGMLGGLGTLVIIWAGWQLGTLFGKAAFSQRQLFAVALIIVVCGLTAFASPYGVLMPRTWLQIMDSPILPQIIQEHARLNPFRLDGVMVLILGGFYVFLFTGTFGRWPRVSWIVPLIWFMLACSRIRHAPLFAVTAGFAAADMLPYTRWARWLARPGSDLFVFATTEATASRTSVDWRPTLLPATAVLIALLLQCCRVPCPVLGHGWAQSDPDVRPVELSAALQAAATPEATVPIFNEYQFGGFLIYESYFEPNWPRYRVFVDDRCELYGDRWLETYVHAEIDDPGAHLGRWQQTYGIFNVALTRKGSGFDQYFSGASEWQRLAEGEAAVLYRRNDAASATAAATKKQSVDRAAR